jgi:glycerophosphoryl diester phosphodiesterase
MDIQVASVAVPGVIPPAENRIDGPDVASVYIPGPAGIAVLRAAARAESAAAEAVEAAIEARNARHLHYLGGMIHAAHRGYAAHSIENTMTAFSKAIQYRADALELDVQISSDGVPVVIHDSTVDYSTTSTGNVKDFTAAELRAMTRDARYGAIYEKSYIPTFSEVIALAKQHQIPIWPEVKGYRTPDDIALMVQVVKDAGYEHMTKFQSFNFSDLPIVRSLSSIVSLGHTNGATDFRTYADDLLALGGECWIVTSIAKALLHPEYVAELQGRGIRVALYTAYLSSDVAKAESTGADAVICDRNLKGTR